MRSKRYLKQFLYTNRFFKSERLEPFLVKFIYSEKATKFCKIFSLLLNVCTVVKSKGKISQNSVAFSEYMKFDIFYALINFEKKTDTQLDFSFRKDFPTLH